MPHPEHAEPNEEQERAEQAERNARLGERVAQPVELANQANELAEHHGTTVRTGLNPALDEEVPGLRSQLGNGVGFAANGFNSAIAFANAVNGPRRDRNTNLMRGAGSATAAAGNVAAMLTRTPGTQAATRRLGTAGAVINSLATANDINNHGLTDENAGSAINNIASFAGPEVAIPMALGTAAGSQIVRATDSYSQHQGMFQQTRYGRGVNGRAQSTNVSGSDDAAQTGIQAQAAMMQHPIISSLIGSTVASPLTLFNMATGRGGAAESGAEAVGAMTAIGGGIANSAAAGVHAAGSALSRGWNWLTH